jgi:phage protein D
MLPQAINAFASWQKQKRTMTQQPIYQGQDFYAPRFEIKLRGQNLAHAVIHDVREVQYTDNIERFDFFEFVLNDWDPVRRVPKYSSPYDESGQPQQLEDGSSVPLFEPGALVELRMGYYGAEDPALMMTGQIISITPNFPASGDPSMRVRAVNLLYTLQRGQMNQAYFEMTNSEIAQAIASELDIAIEIPPGQIQDESINDYLMISNEYPITFLLRLARRQGYDLYVKIPSDGGDPQLYFGRTPTHQITYEIEWGRSLIQFTPTVKVKGQVAEVVVRGWNPLGSGGDRAITGRATWADIGYAAPDRQLLAAVDSALAQTYEEIVDEPLQDEQQANERARSILQGLANDLITGQGSTIGLPHLRAGRVIALKGLGVRYSGRYFIKESTHRIGANGYVTEFTARLGGVP